MLCRSVVPVVYPTIRHIGLSSSARRLMVHLLEEAVLHPNPERTLQIALERSYLQERLAHKPGAANILNHLLPDLYADAREHMPTGSVPPTACPYTLDNLLSSIAAEGTTTA